MEITTRQLGRYTVVNLSGKMDAVTAPLFEETMAKESLDANLIVDMSSLEYISSAGLRCFLLLAKHLKTSNGSIALCGLSGLVQEVFDLSGFGQLFPVADSIDAARRQLDDHGSP